MKKVGIITLTGNKNFGNKLQNYALQEIIRKNGYNVNTIWVKKKYNLMKIKRIVKLFLKKDYKLNDYKRERIFEKYNKKYLNCYYMKSNNAEILDEKYDYYVIGSDQIWNPDVRNAYLGISILDNKKPKISYSASLGVSQVPSDFEKIIKQKFILSNIKCISVRENAGKEIIESITNRKDVKVLIDPTMVLDSTDWEKQMKIPKNIDKLNGKKFILNYFLGELSNERKNAIEKFAQVNDCTIINILDKNDDFYVSGPSEFLWLEKNAFMICTDSFHSSVFGLLFDKPFVIFDREGKNTNMSSRLDTLIDKFKLTNRKFNGTEITNLNLNHDYSKAYKILDEEREKSRKFIEESIR